jgi:proline iminopeptidase
MKYFYIISVFFYCALSSAQVEHIINAGDQQIYCRTFGEGIPILIINGGPGMNSNGFESLANELGKDYQAIIYDQRGTGRSTMASIDSSTMTMHLMAEDIELIRRYFRFEEWVVLGHSFGGMMASYYTAQHPERVQALILSSSGGLDLSLLDNFSIRSALSDTEQDSLSYWTERISNGDTSYHSQYQRGTYLARAYLHDSTLIPKIAHRLTQLNRPINGLLWQNMRSMNFDVKEDLSDFIKPVLIIQGKHDIISPEIAYTADQVFPNSTLLFLPAAAHYGWLEQAELYFGAIRELLTKVEHN